MSFYEIPADKRDHLYLKCAKTLGEGAHFHESIEVMIVIEGSASAFINGVKYEVRAGEAVAVNSFDIHYYKTNAGSLYVALVVSSTYLREFYDFAKERTLVNHFNISPEASEFARAWAASPKDTNRLSLLSKLYRLLSYLPLTPAENASRPKPIITEIFGYLHKSFKEQLSVESVAEKFGYSRGYLSTLFSAYTGESLGSYVNRLRLKEFAKLQKAYPESNVLDLALDAGFESASTFYRAYKKQFGKTPQQKI